MKLNKPRIKFFAPWAKIVKPFTVPKHTLEDKNNIVYNVVEGEEYRNHIEMAGFFTSSIISYGCDEAGTLRMMRHCAFPNLRKNPNTTHSSYDNNYKGVEISVNGVVCKEKVIKFQFDGKLTITSRIGDIEVKRCLFSAVSKAGLIEMITFINHSKSDCNIQCINKDKTKTTLACFGHNKSRFDVFCHINNDKFTLASSGMKEIEVIYSANLHEEKVIDNNENQSELRNNFINTVGNCMQIITPNKTINAMSEFAKIRACESIFNTKAGLMHSPGGGGYYGAVWTNDQCEYANPFFGYVGYKTGIEQSINCYNMYKKYISADKALITSIISCGDGIWHGAKDRGDSAMYAYGLSRFLLSVGDKELALTYVSYIEDCLKWTLSQKNAQGVIKSDSDELENRFESGNANLCTSCLAYDALISAKYLFGELNQQEKANYYEQQAEQLRKDIVAYFGKTVEGYDTFMYCAEETKLRSWICMPMTVGIFDKASETADALLSDKLKVSEGLVTRSGEKTFWDRSTLYAMRGLFYAGMADKAIELFEVFSEARLLGEHIPYSVEAFPEGNQAQLSAESALYFRILAEGVVGYRPSGFGKFILSPNLPTKWDKVEVKSMWLAGKKVDINIVRKNNTYDIDIVVNGKKIIAKANEEIII